jgi:serine/threonine protein kinase
MLKKNSAFTQRNGSSSGSCAAHPRGRAGEYTSASDVFSFGVVLLELLTGEPPIDAAQRPSNFYARMRRLPSRAEAAADPAAGWAVLPGGGAEARGLGALAARCVCAAGSGRPSFAEVCMHARTHAREHEHECPLARSCDILQCAQALAELERQCSTLPENGEAWAGRTECVVCMAAPRSTLLRPCCHSLLCAMCAADMVRRGDGCPACRAAVERYEEPPPLLDPPQADWGEA